MRRDYDHDKALTRSAVLGAVIGVIGMAAVYAFLEALSRVLS